MQLACEYSRVLIQFKFSAKSGINIYHHHYYYYYYYRCSILHIETNSSRIGYSECHARFVLLLNSEYNLNTAKNTVTKSEFLILQFLNEVSSATPWV